MFVAHNLKNESYLLLCQRFVSFFREKMGEKPDQSPGSKALTVAQSLNEVELFKTPVGLPKRRNKQKVLDEESYVEEIGKIIQRDFFPDLEKLKAQNEYLGAVERNDHLKIRELYAKYSGKRPPAERLPSPASWETPANLRNLPPSDETPSSTTSSKDKPEKPPLSLDQFLNSHTSQDNESFEDIMVESEKKHRLKYSYLYNEEDRSGTEQKQLLALPSIEEQCALPEKKLDVDTWGYKNKNYIMYVPDGVDPSNEELAEMERKRLEVVYGNTRLKRNPFNEAQSQETINELAKTQAKSLDGKIGADGKEIVRTSPKVNGFSFVRTPSPCPASMDSPLMTWGEIEGTPFRLDGSDTPLPRSTGPSFKMNEPPKREQIAIALAEKVGERHRDQKKKAIDAARRNFATPSPRPTASPMSRLRTMSPAARRLASANLRLSTGSMFGTGGATPTSLRRTGTPQRAVTPKLDLGIRKPAADDNLTDDLLAIPVPVPKRQRAADFF